MPRDRIQIQDLEVRCVVGVYPSERLREQELRVDLELGLDLRRSGRSGRLGDTCDYTRIADEVEALLCFRRYRLLEVAAEELAAMVLGIHPGVEDLALTLIKPGALPGRARAAAITIRRQATDYPRRTTATAFGREEALLETAEAGLYLLHLAPGGALPALPEASGRLDWHVAGELLGDHGPLTGGAAIDWRGAAVTGYRNPSAGEATLFRCDLAAGPAAGGWGLSRGPGS